MHAIPRLSLVLDACSTIAGASGQDQSSSVAASDEASTLQPVEVSLPDTVYAVVGDTLQLFYRGMVKTLDPYAYNLFVTCAKGRTYPRYFEYTPTSDDVGAVPWTLEVKDAQNRVLGKQTCTLVTKAAVCSPAAPLSVLCIGDSLTAGGVWCKEANRRLTGTGGMPAGLGLTNITFVGRFRDGDIGWEGNGGWSWTEYTTHGRSPAYRFRVADVVTAPLRSSRYRHNGIFYDVQNTDLHAGSGTVRCGSTNAPAPIGILQKTAGVGDEKIVFSAFETESGNPFWNAATDKLDLRAYVDRYCGGKIDIVYFLLSWNGQTAYRTDFSDFSENIRILVDHLHAVYPQVAVKLMGIQVPSQNGGMGANYAAGSGYSDAYGMTVTALNMNTAYAAFAKDPAYAEFVEFVNVSAQFDSENNMPEADVPVNCRNPKTEKRGTNGVHPAEAGYGQIADVMFRNFVARYAQAEPLEERE